MKKLSAFLLTLLLSACVQVYEFEISTPCEKIISNNSNEPIVTTIAGNGIYGYKDGLASEAQFAGLRDMVIDKSGNIYVLDNSGIRKIEINGIVSTFVKKENIQGYTKNTYFRNIEIDNDNNIYFIYERNYEGNAIGKINQKGESIIFAGNPNSNGFSDGNRTEAKFYAISDIAIDQNDNIFVIESYKIRKINKSGEVSTIVDGSYYGSNDGIFSKVTFQKPYNIKIDSENNIFLIDNNSILKISNGIVSTFKAKFFENDYYNYNDEISYIIDKQGNFYFTNNNTIKKMTPDGKINDFAGTGTGCIDGSASKAKFNSPLLIYNNDVIYILDINSNRIRKFKI